MPFDGFLNSTSNLSGDASRRRPFTLPVFAHTFDNNYWLDDIVTTNGGTDVQNLTYGLDNAENLTSSIMSLIYTSNR